MILYTGIFLASLVSALLARNVYKAVVAKDRQVQAINKRTAVMESPAKYKKARAAFNTCNGIPIPSVQESQVAAMNLGKSNPAKPVVCQKRDASWLVHEQKAAPAGKSYKVKRRVEPVVPTLEMTSKPFRREVAPWATNNKIAVRPWKTS